MHEVRVPANVPEEFVDEYIKNFSTATHGTGKLVLFAGDQKIEHLNADFVGEGIAEDDADPEHLFRIASQARIGVFAAQHGLISHYGRDYPNIPYLVKMNSKSNLDGDREPLSLAIVDIDDVLQLKENGVTVLGIGYTIYLGSEHETEMFAQAGRLIAQAHALGLICVVWMYPRGATIHDEKDAKLIAGAAGVAVSLGADFVKVNQPVHDGKKDPLLLREAVLAGGRCGVITSGGASEDPGEFLHLVHEQLHQSGTRGCATGRNVHQKPLEEAVRMCNALAALVYDDVSTHDAWLIYSGKK